MKKYFVVLLSLFFVLAFWLSSCKQCNTTKADVAKTDSVAIPKLDAVSEEIRKDSLNPFLYYKRAQLYEANNDFKSAATDMYLALSLDSLRPEFYIYTAELFKKTGEPQRGIALMNKAIVTDSMNTNFYVKAAELAYIDTNIKGSYMLALNYLNTAIEKDPQNADIYFYKGTIFKEIGDTTKALSSFQTATELNPKFYNAYVQIGLLLKNKKDKNAEKYFDNAIKVSDKPEDALYAKANLLKEEGVRLYDAEKFSQADDKLNKAVEQFKKVIEVNYKNAEAYMGTGFCYYQMDSLQEAYNYYEMATKIEPAYAGAYFSKGLCAEDLGRKKEAMALYQTCLNIDPTFKRAEEHLKKLQATQ
ncbi:MAG: tetratricopeptide repeat protein [Bacteroidota bacterium]